MMMMQQQLQLQRQPWMRLHRLCTPSTSTIPPVQPLHFLPPRPRSSPASLSIHASAASSAAAASTSGRNLPWLVVGLGNPGCKFEGTRHNIGFDMIDAIAESEGIPLRTIQHKALLGKSTSFCGALVFWATLERERDRDRESPRRREDICTHTFSDIFWTRIPSEFISEGLMARYGVDCGVSYSHRTGFQTSNNCGEGDDDLLSTYSMLPPTHFTDMASFKKCVVGCYKSFVAGSSVHHQYMAFTNVTPKHFSKIDALREGRTSLPKMVVLYDAIEEVLIVKIMPSPLHDAVAMQFVHFLFKKFMQLGVDNKVFGVGSGRFGDVNVRCKEADSAFRPVGRHGDDFPSLVVEVGVSESLQMLRNDAWHWLTKTGGQTRIVIILHIDKSSRKILLQRWECVNDECPCCATVQYPPLPRAIQSLELEAGRQYVGDALEIPAVKVFDIVPNNLPNGEFVFTHTELQGFCDFYWSNV